MTDSTHKTRIIAVANQKGGVGKTTTTVNLAACIAEAGKRVLVIDLDPQGNASSGLNVRVQNLESTIYQVVVMEAPIEDCIEPTEVKNLFIVPSTLDLAGADIELVTAIGRETRLKRALADVLDDYDYVFIDCAPSLGLLTLNALVAAEELLMPVQCEYFALEGVGQLLGTVEKVRKSINPVLEVTTIVCTMFDSRTKLSQEVVDNVREFFGDKVCKTIIPRNTKLAEAPSAGKPIITYDPTGKGSKAYREVAKEVMAHGK